MFTGKQIGEMTAGEVATLCDGLGLKMGARAATSALGVFEVEVVAFTLSGRRFTARGAEIEAAIAKVINAAQGAVV